LHGTQLSVGETGQPTLNQGWQDLEAPEGVNQAEAVSTERETRDASAVCKHPNPDAEGSDATSLAS
jgi:hypothetical protein